MTTIIIQFYAPGWFKIKSNYLTIIGSQNFWYLAQLIKNAVNDAKYKEIMEKVLCATPTEAQTSKLLYMLYTYIGNPHNMLLLKKKN